MSFECFVGKRLKYSSIRALSEDEGEEKILRHRLVKYEAC